LCGIREQGTVSLEVDAQSIGVCSVSRCLYDVAGPRQRRYVDADLPADRGRGIAGGLPLAAVTGRAELMDAPHAGGLGGTYGGNPVACAAALGAIETMQKLDLAAAAQRIEQQMVPRLRDLAGRYPAIGDVRGRGAMIAVELVRPGTTEPDAALTSAVTAACHAAGVVTLTCGTYGNVLRFLPPLVMPEHLLDDALDVLEQAFAASAR